MLRALTAALLASALLGLAPGAAATPQPQKTLETEREVIPRLRVSLDDAVKLARDRVPGRVVGAQSRYHRGRVTHEVKILTDGGSVHVVRVDGETGRVTH